MERRRGGNNYSSVIGIFLIFTVVLIFAFIFYYKVKNEGPSTDSLGCPNDSSYINEKWTVVIDITSSFEGNQLIALSSLAEQIISVAPKYTRLDIFKMTSNILDKSDILLSVCSPGDPMNINKWTQSQALVKKNFTDNYERKIQEVIHNLQKSTGFDSSPIIESIQALALIQFNDKKFKGKNKVYFVSDFIQKNTEQGGFNFYQSLPKYNLIKQSGQLNKYLSQLDKIEFNALVLENNNQIQNNEFREFWKNYFYDSRALYYSCSFGANCDL